MRKSLKKEESHWLFSQSVSQLWVPYFIPNPAPFFHQTSLDDVKAVFDSLEKKGFGTVVKKGSSIFFQINPTKLRSSYAELGVTRSEIEKALRIDSKIPPQYKYLETSQGLEEGKFAF